MKDTLQRFLFENLAIRGELVHLDATWQAVLEQHDYQPAIKKVLGELMCAVSLLLATLKFKGQLIAQIQGDGPVSLLVVEGSSDNTLRAMASYKDKKEQLFGEGLSDLFGTAKLLITLEPDEGGRYQGIVVLSGDNLASAITDYLHRSEQLDTYIWLVTDDHQAAGLLIQKLPETHKLKQNTNFIASDSSENESDTDAWNRIYQLSATIKNDELLNLCADDIIYRLYHEENIRMFEVERISFRCRCSRERVANMLLSLGEKEVKKMLNDLPKLEVACEFCNHNYSFDAVDTHQIFSTNLAHIPPQTEQ